MIAGGLRALASTAAGVHLLGGCAVLTVDVDVYKGPLANQREVQAQRIAGLAIGAKPLLVDLRNRLELRECWRLDNPQGGFGNVTLERYRAGIIGTDNGEQEALLTEVRKSRNLRPAEKEGTASPNAPAAGSANIRREEGRKSQLEGGAAGNEEPAYLRAHPSCPKLRDVFSADSGRGGVNPSNLVSPQARKVNDLLSLYDKRSSMSARANVVIKTYAREQQTTLEGIRRAAGLIDAYPHCISDPQGSIDQRIVLSGKYRDDACKVAAKSLTDIDEMTATLLSRTLRLLGDKDIRDSEDVVLEMRLVEVVDSLIDYSLLPLLCSRKTALAEVVSQALGEEACDIPLPLYPREELRLRNKMRDMLRALDNRSALAAFADDRTGQSRALVNDLLALHNFSIQSVRVSGLARPPEIGSLRIDDKSSAYEAHTFKAGSNVDKKPFSVQDLREFISPLIQRTAEGALSQGRVEEGLESLVNVYLGDLRTSESTIHEKLSEKEKALLTGLLTFAEKVLFLANSERLLAEASEDETVKRYVRVLQAVGGSMLSQIDERYRSHRFETRGEVAAAEVFAYARRTAKEDLLIEMLDKVSGSDLEQTEKDQVQEILKQAKPELEKLLSFLVTVKERKRQAVLTLTPLSNHLSRILEARDEPAAKGEKLKLDQYLQKQPAQWLDYVRTANLEPEVASFRANADCAADGSAWKAAECMKACAELKKAMGVKMGTLIASGDLVEKWSGTLSSTVIVAPGSEENLLRSYDLLVETLRLRHIDAVASRDARAEDMEAAISLAEEYRSGKLYIRPAMAFLRDSYPASDLQQEGAVFWQNLLGEQLVRTAPVFGQQQSDDARIQSAIDKAYWQSINQVRLAGLNRTTYAVTKDDIGNWYVKGYKADPEEMIATFKNVAKFSLGGEVRQTLVRSPAKDPSAAALPTSSKPILQSQYEEQTANYENRVRLLLKELKRALLDETSPDSLTEGVRSAARSKMRGDAQDRFKSGAPSGNDMIQVFDKSTVAATLSIGPEKGRKTVAEAIRQPEPLGKGGSGGYRSAMELGDLLNAANLYAEEQIQSIARESKKVDSTVAWPGNHQSELQSGIAEGARAFVLRYVEKWKAVNRDYAVALDVIGGRRGTAANAQ